MGNSTCGRILLPLALFCALAVCPLGYHGVAHAASVDPPFDISGDVDMGPAIEYQVGCGVAFDGTNYLVVWSDYRSNSSYDIFAARVALDGTIIDEGGFLISDADGYQEDPVVAFDGTNYLVVWVDRRSGTGDIYGSRVDPAGNVLDPDGIPICTEPDGQAEAAIAFDDTSYLVIWIDLRDGNENVYGTRMATDGSVLDPSGIAICTDAAVQRYPAVSSNGAGWLAVWMDPRNSQPDIYGARLDGDGTVLDPGGIPVAVTAADETYPDVTRNDTDCLVVWDLDAGATEHDIYGARVDTAGAVLDPAGIAICSHIAHQGRPAASSDGSNFFTVWLDVRSSVTWDVYGARVDSAGTVIDTAGVPICVHSSVQYGLDVAFGGPNWLVTWHDSRNDHKDIFGARVETDGTLQDPTSLLISCASIDQEEESIAFDGTNFFVVWHEWRVGTTYDIRGTRVSMDGDVLDPEGIEVCVYSGDAMYPAVSFCNDVYLVVWQDYRFGQWDIMGARVDTTGAVLDSIGFPISVSTGSQMRPALDCNDARWLVAWQDNRSGASYDIYGSRVTGQRNVYEPEGLLISEAYGVQARPAVGSDGDNYFVVWDDERNGLDDIFGARVDREGVVLDSAGIGIAEATYLQERPDVAFDGNNYAVIWQDNRTNIDYDIYMTRVGTDGTVIEPSGIAVSIAAGDQKAPAITFNGRNYVSVWQDDRMPDGYDIYGARVDTSGTVTDPGGFEVSGAPHDQVTPDLSAGTLGVTLMTYSSFISDPGYGSYRIWANFYDVVADIPGGPAQGGHTRLYPNFPNPFRGSTELRFSLPERAEVTLKVYDVEGRLMATVFDGPVEAGLHSVCWDPASVGGRAVAPGLYFCRFTAGTHRETQKLLLLR